MCLQSENQLINTMFQIVMALQIIGTPSETKTKANNFMYFNTLAK